jgi:acyl-CoA reductase-like NAD-dependent aldehyde dehydrogenase
MEILHLIQAAKRALISPSFPNLDQRFSFIEKLSKHLLEHKQAYIASLAASENLETVEVEAYFFDPILRLINNYLNDKAVISSQLENTFPTGLIAVILPRRLSWRLACENFVKSFLAGNVSVFKFPATSSDSCTLFQTLIATLGIPDGIVGAAALERTRVEGFLSEHPSVDGVLYYGTFQAFQKMVKSQSLIHKKWQAGFGGPTTLCVGPDADLATASETILRNSFFYHSDCPLRVSRVYCLDSQIVELSELLAEKVKQLKPLCLSQGWSEGELAESLKAIKISEGRILSGGDISSPTRGGGILKVTPLLVKDLPNCELQHQVELRWPVLLLGSVKYAHELSKWVNNSKSSYMVLLVGNEDKLLRQVGKFDTSTVLLNRDVKDLDEVPIGIKESSYGVVNRQIFGEFFTHRRKIVR